MRRILGGLFTLAWLGLTCQAQASNVVALLDKGAACTGTDATAAQDLAALNAAITDANATPGTRIVFPAGRTCVINDTPTAITESGTIIWGYGATLKQIGTDDAHLIFQGSLTTPSTIVNASHHRFIRTITVVSSTNFTAKNPVIIFNQSAGAYAENEVESVPGGTSLTLKWPLGIAIDHTFTVQKYTPIERIGVWGLRLTMADPLPLATRGSGIICNRCRKAVFRDLDGYGLYDALVSAELGGRDITFENNRIYCTENGGLYMRGIAEGKIKGNAMWRAGWCFGLTTTSGSCSGPEGAGVCSWGRLTDGAIMARQTPGIVIENNTITRQIMSAIWVENASHALVQGNWIREGDATNTATVNVGAGAITPILNGIYADPCDDCRFIGNFLQQIPERAIAIENSNHCAVVGNQVLEQDGSAHSRLAGLRLRNVSYCEVSANLLSTSQTTKGVGAELLDVQHLQLVGNTIAGYSRSLEAVGAISYGVRDSMIVANTMRSAGTNAMQLQESSRNFIAYNQIQGTVGAGVGAIDLNPKGGGAGSDHNHIYLNRIDTNSGGGSAVRTSSTDNQNNVIKDLITLNTAASVSLHTTNRWERDLVATGTWNPDPFRGVGTTVSTTITAPGASPGDVCYADHSQIGAYNVMVSCHIQAADTARVVLMAGTGAEALDIRNGTVRVIVLKGRD